MLIFTNLKSFNLHKHRSDLNLKGLLAANIGLEYVSHVHPFSHGLSFCHASTHPSRMGNSPASSSFQFMSPAKITLGKHSKHLRAFFAWATRSSVYIRRKGSGLSRWQVATINDFPLQTCISATHISLPILEFLKGQVPNDSTGSLLSCNCNN